MRSVVVYESMYGNTHRIAERIGAGLAGAGDVTVVALAEVTADVLAGADLVVVGGPTHVHGMSRPGTRRGAVEAAAEPGSELTLEPVDPDVGLREWFAGHPVLPARAAAFDTRVQMSSVLSGRASRGIAKLLKDAGCELVAGPESFLVTKATTLVGGEVERAEAWGAGLPVHDRV